jgi:hypothetical protein
MKASNKQFRLEENELWREACDLAEYMYGKLHELPEEEKWDTEVKLRHAANDLMFYVSQAVGNASPSGNEYDWSLTRKCAFGLKTIYRFAGRQKFIELEPKIMVRTDKLIREIDAKIAEAYKQTEAKNRTDFERWRMIVEMQREAWDEGAKR